MRRGGSEPLAQQLAACFIDKPVVYAYQVYRDSSAPGGFTERSARELSPSAMGPKLRMPVAVLMGPENMSSCEGFLLMMRQAPRCKLVGGRSYGSSGNPKPHVLGNGVTIYVPSWKSMTAEGEEFEGKGLPPDIEVKTRPSDFEQGDPVLEAGLKGLREEAAKGE